MAKKVRLVYVEVKRRSYLGNVDAMADTVLKMQGLIKTRYDESPDWVIHDVAVFSAPAPGGDGSGGGRTYMMVSMTRDR